MGILKQSAYRYCVSKNSCPFLSLNSLYKNEQDFLTFYMVNIFKVGNNSIRTGIRMTFEQFIKNSSFFFFIFFFQRLIAIDYIFF